MKLSRGEGDMLPQDFCCLPWCGRSHGAPYKSVTVDGEHYEYPERIDAHHSRGQKRGPIVYICHECHMQHHSGGRKLRFTFDGNGHPSVWDTSRDKFVPCVVSGCAHD